MRETAVRVVLVEDDEDARLLLKTVLERANCTVQAFADADAAQQAASTCPPDVVITDLRLRGCGGSTLAAALRERNSTRHVALIAVTGVVEPGPEVAARFDAYLRKPVDVTLLVQLVMQLAAVSRSASPRSAVG